MLRLSVRNKLKWEKKVAAVAENVIFIYFHEQQKNAAWIYHKSVKRICRKKANREKKKVPIEIYDFMRRVCVCFLIYFHVYHRIICFCQRHVVYDRFFSLSLLFLYGAPLCASTVVSFTFNFFLSFFRVHIISLLCDNRLWVVFLASIISELSHFFLYRSYNMVIILAQTSNCLYNLFFKAFILLSFLRNAVKTQSSIKIREKKQIQRNLHMNVWDITKIRTYIVDICLLALIWCFVCAIPAASSVHVQGSTKTRWW